MIGPVLIVRNAPTDDPLGVVDGDNPLFQLADQPARLAWLAQNLPAFPGTGIVYFALITFFNLLVDVAYTWLDPRLRTQR